MHSENEIPQTPEELENKIQALFNDIAGKTKGRPITEKYGLYEPDDSIYVKQSLTVTDPLLTELTRVLGERKTQEGFVYPLHCMHPILHDIINFPAPRSFEEDDANYSFDNKFIDLP